MPTRLQIRKAVADSLAHATQRVIVDGFHWIWYRKTETWFKNTWFGYPIQQAPSDIYLYQELIHRERPAFILQTGVYDGGSILFFAHLLDLLGADARAVVIGIDVELRPRAKTLDHPRIRLVEGSSTDRSVLNQVQELLPAPAGLVILDSDHQCGHVLQELRLYNQFTGIGDHLVVEDTNLNGHPVLRKFGPGPFEAVDDFLREDPRFVRDDAVWKRLLFSHHQYGWLRRIG